MDQNVAVDKGRGVHCVTEEDGGLVSGAPEDVSAGFEADRQQTEGELQYEPPYDGVPVDLKQFGGRNYSWVREVGG